MSPADAGDGFDDLFGNPILSDFASKSVPGDGELGPVNTPILMSPYSIRLRMQIHHKLSLYYQRYYSTYHPQQVMKELMN